jgi:hypothetical protein
LKSIQRLIDEARELEIQWCAKNIEVAMAMDEREQAHAWRITMERAIAERSPAQVQRMEAAIGLEAGSAQRAATWEGFADA